MMGNYHARCGAGEKPEVVTPEAYLSLFALPDDYCSLLSTMRSREISSVIIIQNMAQIKALFKDTWETIPGNCDTMIFLGGNEQSTHKYVSEALGKGTIDKRTTGETRGRQGSSSKNYDVLGRELLTPDEARKLDNTKCLLIIRGFDPIIDDKYNPFGHPRFNETADGKGEAYVHEPRKKGAGKGIEVLNPHAVAYYEKKKGKGENVAIDTLTYGEFQLLGELDMTESDTQTAEDGGMAETKGSRQSNLIREDNLTNRMVTWSYTKEQKDVLRSALKEKMPREDILSFFYPDIPVEQMLRALEKFKAQEKQTKGGAKK